MVVTSYFRQSGHWPETGIWEITPVRPRRNIARTHVGQRLVRPYSWRGDRRRRVAVKPPATGFAASISRILQAVVRYAAPGPNDREKRSHTLRCRGFGVEPRRNCFDVAKRREVQLKALYLRPQAAKDGVNSACKLWLASEQKVHVHRGSGETGAPERSIKGRSQLRVYS